MTGFSISQVTADDPIWHPLLELAKESGQEDWFNFKASWHTGNHVLVATIQDQPVGFLRFVTQPIGLEDDHDPIIFHNKVLTEAKVLAFWVRESARRLGIGRALQRRAFERACTLGCYQVRSFSSGTNNENHQLKLSMGFALQPVVRGDDAKAVYFVMPCGNHNRRKE